MTSCADNSCPTPILGNDLAGFSAENTTFQSTTGLTLIEALNLSFTIFNAGDYFIRWWYVWSYDSISQSFSARVQVDNSINLINPAAVDGNQTLHIQEPSDAGGTGNGGTKQRFISSGFAVVNFSAGSHDVDLDFASTFSGNTASIHHCRLFVQRA